MFYVIWVQKKINPCQQLHNSDPRFWDHWARSSESVFTLVQTHTQRYTQRHTISRPLWSCDACRVKINVTAEPYCTFPPLSISFIHSRVIGSQFELPLCLLWAHFALTECGRLMATSSQGRLASASMSALNSLHQFPPVLCSPILSPTREKKRGKTRMKRDKSKIVRWWCWKTERGEETKD